MKILWTIGQLPMRPVVIVWWGELIQCCRVRCWMRDFWPQYCKKKYNIVENPQYCKKKYNIVWKSAVLSSSRDQWWGILRTQIFGGHRERSIIFFNFFGTGPARRSIILSGRPERSIILYKCKYLFLFETDDGVIILFHWKSSKSEKYCGGVRAKYRNFLNILHVSPDNTNF